MKLNYNKITFGNHFNEELNSVFVFKQWKDQWKKYQDKTKYLIDEKSYNYVVDFDIASFFDTINHGMLKDIFQDKLDDNVTNLLFKILQSKHTDFPKFINSAIINIGLPQGPLASNVISEVFLHYFIDKYFIYILRHTNDMAYIRYADDIRIFTNTKVTASKYITLLDLLCRNLGLIPQSSKIGIKYYESSHEMIDSSFRNFSMIDKYYKTNKRMKAKDNNKAIQLIKEMLISNDIDKTKFKFYLYRIPADNEIKTLIINKIVDRYEYCEPMIHYLYKHFRNEQVQNDLIDIFFQKDIFFLDYPLYLFLRTFYKELKFDRVIFNKILDDDRTGKWLSKLAALEWAEYHNQETLLISLNISRLKPENVVLKQKYYIIKNKIFENKHEDRHELMVNMLSCVEVDVSSNVIHNIYYEYLFNQLSKEQFKNKNNLCDFILFKDSNSNIVDFFCKMKLDKIRVSKLFNKDIFCEIEEFETLSGLCDLINSYHEGTLFKFFIDSVDQFNHVLIERLHIISEGVRPSNRYGSVLNSENFISEMIGVREAFSEIHNNRNFDLHPKDKNNRFDSKKIRIREQKEKIKQLFTTWIDAIEEIVAWYSKR